MAFQTGTVPSFFDLLTELKNFISTNQFSDTLGTGNGVQTSFSKTLPNTPISGGQLGMFFTIAGVEYLVWEKNGTFEHTLINTSSINKALGSINCDFVQPIDSNEDIALVYSTGTPGRDWIVLLEQNSKDSAGQDAYSGGSNQELIFKNSSISTLDETTFGIREHSRVATNLYGWNLNSYRELNPTMLDTQNWNINQNDHGFSAYDSTNELWSTMSSQSFADDTIVYWFFSNKRRVIVVARSQGNIYTGSYLGAGIRFTSPSRYNIPNLVVGSSRGAEVITSQASTHRFFTKQTLSTSTPGAYFGTLPSGDNFDATDVNFLPQRQFVNSGILKRTKNNKILPLPIYLNETSSPEKVLMQLDNAYLVPYTGLQSEDILQLNGDSYVVFQNVFRNTYHEFTAIKME
jgi:hypothetical protein